MLFVCLRLVSESFGVKLPCYFPLLPQIIPSGYNQEGALPSCSTLQGFSRIYE